jgi:hypothetical protein
LAALFNFFAREILVTTLRKHMRHPWDMWDHSIVGCTRWKIHEQLGERENFHVYALRKNEIELKYITV